VSDLFLFLLPKVCGILMVKLRNCNFFQKKPKLIDQVMCTCGREAFLLKTDVISMNRNMQIMKSVAAAKLYHVLYTHYFDVMYNTRHRISCKVCLLELVGQSLPQVTTSIYSKLKWVRITLPFRFNCLIESATVAKRITQSFWTDITWLSDFKFKKYLQLL
jgi:hypothetical protein